MSFNPDSQFRAIIIRGKSKNDLDNLLPNYARIISDICPCPKAEFAQNFNTKLAPVVGNTNKKTLDNHRTEIAGKLFGLYYVDENDTVFQSERASLFLAKSDQPAFFKDICFKFQFPNGMDSFPNVKNKTDHGLNIRQFSFIIKLLILAEEKGIKITKDEIGYYVLNSLDVLRGNVRPEQVLDTLSEDRKNKVFKKVEYQNKASSFSVQHINEQINLLELANLIRTDSGVIILNNLEKQALNIFAEFAEKKPNFDVYSYDLTNIYERKKMYFDWQIYFSKVSDFTNEFETSLRSLSFTPDQSEGPKTYGARTGMIELGDDGELFVFRYEKERVAKFDKRLTNKVLLLGKTKGLGFDIQSIIAESVENAEFVKYIEVKSTKRMTVPNLQNQEWKDTITMSRNEWVAAMQHQEAYYIYRIYFTPKLVSFFIIHNPCLKEKNLKLKIIPTHYRLDFDSRSIDYKIEQNV